MLLFIFNQAHFSAPYLFPLASCGGSCMLILVGMERDLRVLTRWRWWQFFYFVTTLGSQKIACIPPVQKLITIQNCTYELNLYSNLISIPQLWQLIRSCEPCSGYCSRWIFESFAGQCHASWIGSRFEIPWSQVCALYGWLKIFCTSKRSALRVRKSITTLIEKHLFLKVNRDKLQLIIVIGMKFMGYSLCLLSCMAFIYLYKKLSQIENSLERVDWKKQWFGIW